MIAEHDMRLLIEFSRERCDRGEHPFALMEFDTLENPTLQREIEKDLIEPLREHITESGVVGHINGQLVVLLPNTDAATARRIAQSVLAQTSMPIDAHCFISVYPMPITADRDHDPSYGDGVETLSERNIRLARPEYANDSKKGAQSLINPDLIQIHPLSDLLRKPIPAWKRGLDLIGASALLLALGPVIIACGLYLQTRDPGPIIFRQRRFGYLGKPFSLLKLRTMRQDADQTHHQAHLRQLIKNDANLTKLDSSGDQRVIPGADLMRKLGIDELPQLINVLRGEMSLVGPRPCLGYELEGFRRWHFARFNVLPGLTGLWQVSGKNKTTFSKMLELDVRYAIRTRLRDDLFILLRTPAAVIAHARQTSPNSQANTAYPSSPPATDNRSFHALNLSSSADPSSSNLARINQ
ncbi:sugar transferase [Halochromatium roseum]|uniref:sugar transferase n=1 Tax=Halochromatium roseum TaxID=391920 RepID=UPI001912DD79